VETAASYEARFAPPPYPAVMETTASYEARFSAITLLDPTVSCKAAMRWSNSDPLWDWAAVPSGLTPVAMPLLEPFCRDLLLVAEEGALLPFPFR